MPLIPDTSRLFFALRPDDETRQALTRLTQAIDAKKLKWVQAHNLHVTLVFLGSVDANTESLIKQAAADISAEPFTLTFDTLSHWSKPKILCLTCRQPVPEAAMMLASKLEAAAATYGLHIDTKPYTPHITLARQARYLPDAKFAPIIWHAEAFCLMQSCSEADGTRYRVVQQWPFIKPSVNLNQ